MAELTDDEVRARIVDAAAELFADRGYKGTRLSLVADRAGVSTQTVRRLTGNRAELFRLVMAAKVTSISADRIAAAASNPAETPPLAVILGAGHDVYADPARAWDVLELEALIRARVDPELAALETERLAARYENLTAVIQQLRASGGVDELLDDRALAHLAMALSTGLALLGPVVGGRPAPDAWDAVIARLAASVAPDDPEPVGGFAAVSRWRVRVDVPDRPGDLPRLTRALGALHVYTLAVYVVGNTDGHRTIDLALTAPASVAPEQIVAAAGSAGRNACISPGDPDDALDLPTRVIDGATQLVATPGWTPTGARMLTEADSVEVVSATEGPDSGPHVMRLQWTPTRHVVLHRDWAPFARAERTRGSALLRLSAAVATLTGEDDRLGWVETVAGKPVWIRLAQPIDADAVSAMHARCSADTRYKRYLSLARWQELQLRRLTGGHRGASVVAVDTDGDVIALGNVFPASDHESQLAEVALLVEDAHQGHGLGSIMMEHLIRLARDLGFTEVVAEALADNGPILHVLAKLQLPWHRRVIDGMATWRAPLTSEAVEAAKAV